jgi:hypothetical protein
MIDLLHLGLLPLLHEARAFNLNKRLPKRNRNWYRTSRVSNPYTIDQVEMLYVPW